MSGMYNGSTMVETIVVAATPQAERINLGFTPATVIVTNLTTGAIARLEWDSVMASGEGVLHSAAGAMSWLTDTGIVIQDGSDGTEKGITIPTLGTINDAADEVLSVRITREAKN